MRHIVEYQLGDWVYFNNSPIQVSAIHQKKIGYHKYPGRLDWIRFDQIKQIPITGDLLLKNEFKVTEDGKYEWKRIAGDGSFYLSVEDCGDGLWNLTLEDCDYFGYKSRKEISEKFLKLHHIQHEFNDCGIMAINWKT